MHAKENSLMSSVLLPISARRRTQFSILVCKIEFHFWPKLLICSISHTIYFHEMLRIDSWRSHALYSRGTSLTYGYLINPMRVRSIWLSRTHIQNPASILKLNNTLKKCLDLLMLKFWVCRSKGYKVTSCQSWTSQEKVCRFGHSSWSVCKRDRPKFEDARSQIILKVWRPETLQPFDLQTSDFHPQKIYSYFKGSNNFKMLAVFWRWVLPSQSELISMGFV